MQGQKSRKIEECWVLDFLQRSFLLCVRKIHLKILKPLLFEIFVVGVEYITQMIISNNQCIIIFVDITLVSHGYSDG